MALQLQTEQIALFALSAKYEQLDTPMIDKLKIHLLDSVASLIHSLDKPVIQKLVRQLKQLSSTGPCRVPLMNAIAVDRAAQLYTALIRYPDFMDNYLGKHATCHPSDNIGALLAVSQLNDTSGADLLLGMAIGYQIECRLINEIPVMEKGFDHTALLFSTAAAAGRLLRYNQAEIAHALAMGGVTFNPLITTRSSPTYEWKGLLSSFVAMGVVNILFMAKEAITGPLHLFEGPQGYKQIHGMELDYDWEKESFELLHKCILKKYNAEVHTQSSLEAVLELRNEHQLQANEIKKVEVVTFLTAYHIVGGGEYGDRHQVSTKEQADHSLPYLVAVAILDGQVMPEQLTPERINRADVQGLLKKVEVTTEFPLATPRTLVEHLDPYTIAYPDKLPSKITIHLNNGKKLTCKKEDYPGFTSRPMEWDDIASKFLKITNHIIPQDKQHAIIKTIEQIEKNDSKTLIDAICS